MKTRLIYFIILLSFFFIAFSCNKNEGPGKCEYIGKYTDMLGKVIVNNINFNDEGDTGYVWAIDISKKAFNTENWTIEASMVYNGLASDSILAPAESLPESFKVDNLQIVFSADRYNCCNKLTQPYFRGWYGCKVEITEIAEYD